ncbi:hypothetical protein CG392_06345 [Gardnerella vaginalis]|uniref:DUF6049 family protein n=1 Tax=Gardnerella piotii TaxID=2792977 RepID=A0ABU5MP23_9BIFI|nr:DUF6049 family protein [Gardnerella piotii]MDZ7544171.1 DUF6049 family protein [Gardnerella piotii]MDZ7552462.1 DUF6049 family protein [Gardnerella piotii]RFT24717.1 hypothetical protein CG392_06345 [Gardnerella vaginalis]
MLKRRIGGKTVINVTNVINVIDFSKNQLRKSQKNAFLRLCATTVLMALLLATFPFFFAPKIAYANQSSLSSYSLYNTKSKGISLKIVKSTSILTDKSGYHISLLLKNNSSKDFPEGKIQVTFNPWYTFMSRTDLQKWSQAESRIPTPQLIGEVSVPALASGKSYSAQIDVDANSQNLSNIIYWGPKPVSITYSSLDFKHYYSVKSFVTRANIGIKNVQTPPINVTLLMPIIAKSSDWRFNISKHNISPSINAISESQENLANPTTGSATSSTTGSATNRKIRLSKSSIKRITSLINLVQKHPKLQTIADPNTLKFSEPTFTPSVFMQNNGFNISRYAKSENHVSYKLAGIGLDSWSKKSSVLENSTTKPLNLDSYAFQTGEKWTLRALEQAAANGYKTVVATSGFDPLANRFAVKNGVYEVQTSSGSVKVLSCQETLNELINGHFTSAQSAAETTSAGLLNRLAAQSAFYQMEQPYMPRHLLLTFSPDSSIPLIESVVSILEKSPWISLLDINSLTRSKAITKEHLGYSPVPKTSAIEGKSLIASKSKISQLASDRMLVNQFINSILDQNELNNHKTCESDAQSLAKQNAKLKINQNSKIWSENLIKLFDAMAQRELDNTLNSASQSNSSASESQTQTKNGTHDLAKMLISGINIIPPKDVTLVSETATMPITISNTNPYPISVYLTAYTNSMEIVTRRKTPVKIAANSESQVILPLRSTTSSKVKATFSLEDRNHNVFSSTKETAITSTLQISDKSGTIIIIFAFALGAFGLFRQFNRKKDPDE